jgi:hypothetical protein
MALVNLKFEQHKWILKCYWKTENVEYPSRSSNLTPLDFLLWGALKNAVYTSKPCTLEDLKHDIEITCAIVPLATIQNVCCMSSTMHCCWWWTF